MITSEKLLQAYPKFAELPLPQVEVALQSAEKECPERTWRSDRDDGILLYACHLLEMEWGQMIQTSGAATAIARGQSGSAFVPAGDHLDKTIYGQRFRSLRKTLVMTTGFVV